MKKYVGSENSSPEIKKILSLFQKKGFPIFTGEMNINIYGIRRTSQMNKFDDEIGVIFNRTADVSQWELFTFKATTDPGLYYLNNPQRISGTAILAEGRHKSAFTFGFHKGEYECLVQKIPVKVYRDRDKDNMLDFTNIEDTFSGIQIHRANPSKESDIVDKWSAGCQVFANPLDFKTFLSLCKLSAAKYGNTFTYTLFLGDN